MGRIQELCDTVTGYSELKELASLLAIYAQSFITQLLE